MATRRRERRQRVVAGVLLVGLARAAGQTSEGEFPTSVDVGCVLYETARLDRLANVTVSPPLALTELWDKGVRFYQPSGATCADGRPFSFGVRRGASVRKLHVHFMGGSFCYSAESCCLNGQPKESLAADLPNIGMAAMACGLQLEQIDEFVEELELGGVFSSQYANPLLDHTLILLPFCSADLWLGNGQASYGSSCNSINHGGTANGRVVMEWIVDLFGGQLDEVVFAGVSGGVPGSIYHGAWMLKELERKGFAPIRSTWIADSLISAFYPPSQWAVDDGVLADLDFLGVDTSGLGGGRLDFGPIHRQMIQSIAAEFPCMTMAEYSPTDDPNQINLLQVTAAAAGCTNCADDFSSLVQTSLQQGVNSITSGQFSSCVVEDESHTVFPLDSLFNKSCTQLSDLSTLQIDEWIESMITKTLSECNAPIPATRLPEATSSPIFDPQDTQPPRALETSACFPGDATVELQSGRVIQMSDLNVGDMIRTGADEWSSVHFFGHREASVMTTYTSIELDNHDIISLSPRHLLFSKREITAGETLVAACSISVGDLLWSSTNASWFPVKRISATRKRGLYHPHTLNGKILVNNVAASCYNDILRGFPSLGPAFHAILFPARAVYRITGVNVLGTFFHSNRQGLVGFVARVSNLCLSMVSTR